MHCSMGNVHSSLRPILPQQFYPSFFKLSGARTDTAQSRPAHIKAKAMLRETWLGNRAAILLYFFLCNAVLWEPGAFKQ